MSRLNVVFAIASLCVLFAFQVQAGGTVNICDNAICGSNTGPDTYDDGLVGLALGGGSKTIATVDATGVNGAAENITVLDPGVNISWAANSDLVLTAGNSIQLNGTFSGSHANASLILSFGASLNLGNANLSATSNVSAVGDGSSSLTGSNVSNAWVLTGLNSGSVSSMNGVIGFSSVSSLMGGSWSDSYTLNGGSLSSTINGGTGTDTLTKSDGTNNWMITAADAGTVTSVGGYFVSMENLGGGTGTDNFIVDSYASLSGSINGGAGTNTLTRSGGSNSWTITGADSGTVTNVWGGFSNIGNLTGGSGFDSYVINGGSLSGSLDGGAGTDEVTVLSGAVIAGELLNIENLTMGGSGSLLFGLDGPGAWDLLGLDGTANLAGELDVSLGGLYSPGAGDSFVILIAETIAGEFDTLTLAALGGSLIWDVEYILDEFGSDTLRISVVSAVPVPATVWLFASGLGMFGWMQRRKSS